MTRDAGVYSAKQSVHYTVETVDPAETKRVRGHMSVEPSLSVTQWPPKPNSKIRTGDDPQHLAGDSADDTEAQLVGPPHVHTILLDAENFNFEMSMAIKYQVARRNPEAGS